LLYVCIIIEPQPNPLMDSQSNNLLQLDKFFCFQLHAASRAVTGLYRTWLEPLGLTYPQYLVMVVLWEKEFTERQAVGRKAVFG
jgi:hypothetical protein